MSYPGPRIMPTDGLAAKPGAIMGRPDTITMSMRERDRVLIRTPPAVYEFGRPDSSCESSLSGRCIRTARIVAAALSNNVVLSSSLTPSTPRK